MQPKNLLNIPQTPLNGLPRNPRVLLPLRPLRLECLVRLLTWVRARGSRLASVRHWIKSSVSTPVAVSGRVAPWLVVRLDRWWGVRVGVCGGVIAWWGGGVVALGGRVVGVLLCYIVVGLVVWLVLNRRAAVVGIWALAVLAV